MINLTKESQQNIVTLKAIFEGATIKEAVEKSEGNTTLIDSEKILFVYFKEKKMTFCKLQQWMKKFSSTNTRELNIDVASFTTDDFNEQLALQAISEAILYTQHQVISYKQEKKQEKANYHLITNISDSTKIFNIAQIKLDSVNLTRNLQDTPPNLMYPEIFAQDIQKVFEGIDNVKITILDKKAIIENKMGLLLAVANGSHNDDPRVVIIEYTGNPNSKEKIGLVGKGITFDSGGYSLKPAASMINMKFDMSGAAIVCSTLLAIAKIKPAINVVAVACLTENRIGGHATLVEAVATAMNGKTVEILNTDAEGRLVLADGITYAIRNNNATKIIDVATLTGAIVVSLGKHATGVFSNNNDFYHQFEQASNLSKERIWRMPIYKENIEEMQCSQIADLANIGKIRDMGSSQAAAFLQEFVEEKPFIHLDIAGTADSDSRGSGVMVKTLVELLSRVK
ncbi:MULTISPECIES: M17 family metallopeptidase [unclassified Spiroplasma]|uniref:M17 family metallopeptidase n=1 Tax=unclassified Spiroplasma TaxID=2637901 RepID=UPI00313C70AD